MKTIKYPKRLNEIAIFLFEFFLNEFTNNFEIVGLYWSESNNGLVTRNIQLGLPAAAALLAGMPLPHLYHNMKPKCIWCVVAKRKLVFFLFQGGGCPLLNLFFLSVSLKTVIPLRDGSFKHSTYVFTAVTGNLICVRHLFAYTVQQYTILSYHHKCHALD